MAVAERKLKALAFSLNTVTNTKDFHLDGVALRHANNHVIDQGTGQTVQRAAPAVVIRTRNLNLATLKNNSDGFRHIQRQRSLGSLHLNMLAINLCLHARRDGDWVLTNTRHC